MGRPRKPTNLKILDGSYRPDKDGDPDLIPQPKRVASIQPPNDLGVDGTKYWNDNYDELSRLGLLTVVDLPQFLELCVLVDKAKHCEQVMADEGAWYHTDKGNILRHPASLQRDKYVAEKMALIRQFGMTPSSRNTLQIKQQAEKSVEFQPLKKG